MTGRGNNTYLFAGPRALLIDAGVGDSRHIAALESALTQASADLADVLVTHAHPDHVSGAAALHRIWPGARFWKFPWPGEDDRLGVRFVALTDGQRVESGEAVLEVIHTPGHSPDHCCFWMPASRTLCCGDLILEGGTVVIPASRGGNMTAYLDSLRRVSRLAPQRILPAHGEPIDRPLELLDAYLAHRQQREGEILAALRNGCSTVEAIAARIYFALPAGLAGAARDTVLAHLIKLEDEGQAEQADGCWQMRNDAATNLNF